LRPTFAPTDAQCFEWFKLYSKIYDNSYIYEDFRRIYVHVDENIDVDVLNYITLISSKYGKDELGLNIAFSTIYATMVSGEKTGDKFNKKLKLLGLHQTIIEGLDSDAAATFSIGASKEYLERECQKRGF
jgi:hypothetical protein